MKARYPDTAEAWLAFLLRAGVTEKSTLALATWCDERPENRAEFELISRGWHLAGEIEPVEMEYPAPSAWLPMAGQRRLAWAAALACVLAMAFWLLRPPEAVSRYETARGEQRTVSLHDGSLIVLNTDTVVDFDSDRQQASLLRGEAFFEVSPRPDRTFSVDAGEARIRVLGTRFNVLRQSGGLLVAVLEGRVRFESRAELEGRDEATEIGTGQVLEVRGSSARILSDTSDLDRVRAWRAGKVELDRTPLGRAVRELSRYTPVPLTLAEPRLEALRVSGIFRIDRLGDLSSIRFALENSLPVELRSAADRLELIPATPP